MANGAYYNPKYEYSARMANGRRHRKRKKRRTSFFYALLVLVVMGLALIMIFSTLFKVDSVVVEGNTRYDQGKIIALSNILLGDNLFNIDTKAAEKNIENDFSYIEDVNISTRLFGTVVIEVVETKIAMAIEYEGQNILLSDKMKVLQVVSEVLAPDIPIVVGISLVNPQEGNTAAVSAEDLDKAEILLELIKALDRHEIEHINRIDISNALNIVIEYDNRVVITFGTRSRMEQKVKNMQTIINGYVEPNFIGVVDVSFLESETRAKSFLKPLSSLDEYYNGNAGDLATQNEDGDENAGQNGDDLDNDGQPQEAPTEEE